MDSKDSTKTPKTVTLYNIMMGFVKQHKTICITYLTILVIWTVYGLVIPHFLGKLYLAFQQHRNIQFYILCVFIAIVMVQIFLYSSSKIDAILFPLFQEYIRTKILQNTFDSKSNNYSESELGTLITQIVKLPYQIYTLVTMLVTHYFSTAILAILVVLYVSAYDVKLASLIFILCLLVLWSFVQNFQNCMTLSVERDSQINNIFFRIDDSIRNMKTVIGFGKEMEEIKRINEPHERYAELAIQNITCARTHIQFINILMLSGLIFIIAYHYHLTPFESHLEISVLITIVIIYFVLYKGIWEIAIDFSDVLIKSGSITNSLNMINNALNSTTYSDKQYPNKSNNIIKQSIVSSESMEDGVVFRNVSFGYASTLILNNASFVIPKNKVTLLIGGIGSGKTTISNLIMKFNVPSSGEIYIDQIPYSQMSTSDVRKLVFILPQNPILFNRSIYENIVYGADPKIFTKHKVYEIITSMGLKSFIDSFSSGLDTNIGVTGSKLSGGQKQIIWLIKVVILDPKIIILDEPTASLDSNIKTIIYKLINEILPNRTVIMITHDQYLLQFAEHIINTDGIKPFESNSTQVYSEYNGN